MKSPLVATLCAIAVTGAVSGKAVAAGELTGDINITNNYIWRGLTQTTNEPAVQGCLEYNDVSGLYIGTWASNVQYAADDVYSYEHDIYAGYRGQVNGFSYDVGYLYYNYDSAAEFDFGEVYAMLGYQNFSASVFVLANTEADEAPGQDFGFGKATYISLDYAVEVFNGTELGLHVGNHQGDFAEAFNGLTESYNDWAVSLSKDGFGFAITGTDMDSSEPAAGGAYDNDEIKFVVSYGVEFQL